MIAEVVLIGLVLSVDSFSAALAMGTRPYKLKDLLKFAFSSSIAEAFFTVLGALAGAKMSGLIDAYDHWVSFVILVIVALHMIYESVTEKNEEEGKEKDFHSFFKILIVSFATSLDAFAVGVTLGLAQKPLIPYTISIGAFAFLSTILGMQIAKKVSDKLGDRINIAGAIVLILLAISFLVNGLQ